MCHLVRIMRARVHRFRRYKNIFILHYTPARPSIIIIIVVIVIILLVYYIRARVAHRIGVLLYKYSQFSRGRARSCSKQARKRA